MNTDKQFMRLNTGAEMPHLGLGTWNASKDSVGSAVKSALVDVGYSHVDCAAVYENEKEVGEAFKSIFSSGQRKREDVFITSKLWNTHHAQSDVVTACKKSLQDLRLNYLDLYLVHFGVSSSRDLGLEPLNEKGVLMTTRVPMQETWEAMEELVKIGLVKAIGVANFTGPMLVDLLTYAKTVPAVNQIELHPYNPQSKLIDFCKYHGIEVTAYSPLGSPGGMKSGEIMLLQDKLIGQIAQAEHKTPAQILLRWGIQRGTVVIPKSISLERIKENSQIFDFSLTQAEMDQLSSLPIHHRYVDPWDWWRIPYFD